MTEDKKSIPDNEFYRAVPGYEDLHVRADGNWVIYKGKHFEVVYSKMSARGGFPKYFNLPDHKGRIPAQRLVALAFCPNPDNKPLVINKSGNTINTHYSNLEWGNNKDIAKHRFNRGEISGDTSFISEEQEYEIAQRLAKGEYAQDLAKEYDTSHATLTRIRQKYFRSKHYAKRYHTEIKELVWVLLQSGKTAREISLVLDLPYETIWRWSKLTLDQLINSPCGHLRIKDVDLTKKLKETSHEKGKGK